MEIGGRTFAVVGFGRSGRAILDFVSSRGGKVIVSEKDGEKENELKELGVKYEIGNSPDFLSKADYIIVSPGVPWDSQFLVELREKGKPVLGEIALALPFIRAKMIGITGSNGKSTTVALVAHILKGAGLKAEACGNIGNPLIKFTDKKYDFLAVELSSFQLEATSIEVFISSILNCSPDHLDRHGGFDTYCQAKETLLENQREGFTILNKDDARAGIWVKKSRVEKFFFSSREKVEKGIQIKNGKGYLHDGELTFDSSKMKLFGLHNLENAAASFLVALGVGLDHGIIRKSIYSFKPLEHRMELFALCKGKSFINDSKATNVDAVRRALESLKGKYILIMGGRGKGESYSSLSKLVKEKVRLIVCIGEEKKIIRDDLGEYAEVFLASSLEEAVELSFSKLDEADGVILSPACASYDMFENFEERGKKFKEEVMRRCYED